ncbi:NADase-type glycan-binding domain-containing protein [Prosthecobacter sp.]|uniref:NADase-type glycan-binding domain-containing protein n=1 Tax=Prosthecobacter sp. TaxID=1965333 RepID=UPI00378333FE
MNKLPFALLIGICVISNEAFANGGGYASSITTAGPFQPIGIEQVEMLSERLNIDLQIEHAAIRVEYLLHNPGKKVKIEAGFPVSETPPYYVKPGTPAPDANPKVRLGTAVAEKLEDFEATLDGKPLEFEVVPDKLDLKNIGPAGENRKVTGWYKVKFPFDAGQARKLIVTYKQNSMWRMTYLFSAAGMWKGPIRDGIVTVRPMGRPKAEIAFNHPKRFEWKEDHWEWAFHDFEPTLEDDLEIQEPKGKGLVLFDINDSSETESMTGLKGVYGARNGTWVNDRFRAESWALHHSGYQVSASSELPDENGISYKAENLRQEDAEHAWTEGVAGDGLGESLVITPDKPAHIRQLGIANGYVKSSGIYEANGRVSALDVSVNGGKPSRVLIPDERLRFRMFYFDLPASKELVKTIKLTIAGVYPGTKFHDTAISRIVLVQPLEKAPKISPIR